MALRDTYDLSLIRNETTEAVYERVERLLDTQPDLCRCEICVLDLVAFTLNRVTPRYTTSLLGDLNPDEAKQRRMTVEIDLALQTGLKRLREHPHHD